MIMEEQTFFTKYTFIPEAQDADQRFVCRILNKVSAKSMSLITYTC